MSKVVKCNNEDLKKDSPDVELDHCRFGPKCRFKNSVTGCRYYHPELVYENLPVGFEGDSKNLEKGSLDVGLELCRFGPHCRFVYSTTGCMFYHPEMATNSEVPGL